jgi:LPS export ABC transporter protein LptC
LKTFRLVSLSLWVFSTLISCVNEKSEVEKVTQEEEVPVESTYDSEIFFSDDAELKIKAFAPEMHRYVGVKQFNEMPKGVDVTFYDSVGVQSSRLTSNYAIDRYNEFIMEAKNDVVIVNAEGEQLNTEHLIWDRKERRIYSDVFVKITTDDEIIMGEGFESNESFSKYKILKPKGVISKDDE